MGRKIKYTKELKIQIVKRYLSEESSYELLAKEIDSASAVVCRWVKKYQTLGENAFDTLKTNSSYTKEFKTQVVIDYLNGIGSYNELANKYSIPSHETIRKWVNDYNSHIGLKDYLPGGKEIYKCIY
ncbi:MAG: transposase [Erysipelotrichales bacterium]|nr:transposase [Erysipelotrichales bacterium]